MCLIVLAWQVHRQHGLIVAANRDEFHERPTEAAQWWQKPAGMFAGRDARAGGAWCAADRDGRFAAVTNVREAAPDQDLRSRGWLVRDYFQQAATARDWADRIYHQGHAYRPFNLLVGDLDSLWFVSNRGTTRCRELRPGIYAISNGHWGEHWPKTDLAETRLAQQVAGDRFSPAAAFELLADTDAAPEAELPDTGIGPVRERFLSSLFIRSAQYGTRASTVITRDHQGALDFHERGFAADSAIVHRVHEHWMLDRKDQI